jgi:hypothetical protein
MTSMDLLSHLVELEGDVAYRVPPSASQPEFSYIEGILPVLLSAPHGAAHYREGKIKEEDEFTAGLARLVAELSGAQALYTRRQSGWDASYYETVPYKLKIAELAASRRIRFVVDLHGAKPKSPFAIAIGTLIGQSCPAQRPLILSTLARYGFTTRPGPPFDDFVDVDNLYTASRNSHQETVTAYVYRELGIPAMQLELNAHIRILRHLPGCSKPGPFHGDPQRIERLIRALVALAKALAE